MTLWQRRSDDPPVSTRRLEALTDGVFAIAATLLVLDLTVKDLGQIADNDQLVTGLIGLRSVFLSFFISFALLSLLWATHVRQFEFISSANHTLMLLNSARLFGVVLIPFTTSINGQYEGMTAGRILLPINFLFVIGMSVLLWFYATNPRHPLVINTPTGFVREQRINGVVSVVVGVIVVALSPFIGSWAFLAYGLNYLGTTVAYTLRTRESTGKRNAAARKNPNGGDSQR
jgi:uncharacterized membrane protein